MMIDPNVMRDATQSLKQHYSDFSDEPGRKCVHILFEFVRDAMTKTNDTLIVVYRRYNDGKWGPSASYSYEDLQSFAERISPKE